MARPSLREMERICRDNGFGLEIHRYSILRPLYAKNGIHRYSTLRPLYAKNGKRHSYLSSYEDYKYVTQYRLIYPPEASTRYGSIICRSWPEVLRKITKYKLGLEYQPRRD